MMSMGSGLSVGYVLSYVYRNLLSIIILTGACFFGLNYVIDLANEEVKHIIEQQTKERVAGIISKHGKNYKLLCLVTNCYAIGNTGKETPGIRFYNKDIDYGRLYELDLGKNKLKDLLNLAITKYELKPIITYGNLDFYSTTSTKLMEVREAFFNRIIILITVIVLVFSLLTVVIRSLIRRHQEMDDKNMDRAILQRQLTESVHHELSAPIEIIRCNLEAAYKKLYPCTVKGMSMCIAPSGKTIEECKNCSLYTRYRESKYRGAAWHYENIVRAIDQISAVLNVMSNNKHISHTNGSISLKSLFENVLASRRILSLNLLKVKVHNLEGLEQYSIGKTGGLNSGKLINVINTLLTNSQEAHANLVEITWSVNPNLSTYIDVDVKDNGRGIRDKKGKVIKDVRKFKPKYGHSTKVSDLDKGVNNKKISRFTFNVFKKLTNIFGNDNDDVNVRGAGLSINKTILELAGGSFKLVQNSETGCTFRLSFPVQEKHGDSIEEKVIKN